MNSRTMNIAIERQPSEVYEYIINPEHFPEWLTSFCQSITKSGDDWIIETSEGPMTINFVEKNNLGIVDHLVRTTSGQEVLNPMRVIANGTGSEVIITIFQLPDISDEMFSLDVSSVERDLKTLRSVLER